QPAEVTYGGAGSIGGSRESPEVVPAYEALRRLAHCLHVQRTLDEVRVAPLKRRRKRAVVNPVDVLSGYRIEAGVKLRRRFLTVDHPDIIRQHAVKGVRNPLTGDRQRAGAKIGDLSLCVDP